MPILPSHAGFKMLERSAEFSLTSSLVNVSLIALDIKYLSFSLDSVLLLTRLRAAVEKDLVPLQTNAGIPASSFL